MKITRKYLRQLIKEELIRLNESSGEDYLNGKRAEAIGLIRNSIVQMADTDDIEISRSAMEELDIALDNGSWKVSRKSGPAKGVDWDEASVTLDWDVENLEYALLEAGVPEHEVERMVDSISFIAAVSVSQSEFDKALGDGSFDALEINDRFESASEVTQKIKKPTNKKVYNGPKGKGQTRYIVTSQMTKWYSEDEANYNSSIFYLVDTVDGVEFEVKGSELPFVLPTTEGEIEIFDILPSGNHNKSHLVAELNGKEFRLARKDI